MTTPLRLVLWDVDGTLLNSRSLILETMHEACRHEGIACPSARLVARGTGLPLVDMVAFVLPDYDAAVHQRVAVAYRRIFPALREKGDGHDRLFPHIRFVLDDLRKQEILMGLVTGMGRRGVLAFVERYGLADYFVTVGTADDGPGKPSPFLVVQAVRQTGAERKNTVVIGDTSFDMMMARAAGVSAIGVAWGNHDVSGLWQAGAEAVAEEPAVLPALIGRVLGRGQE
ncbi:HAD-IA family hydrolase [Haematospirillum jordaniae]|uniref:HAD-IA family hydrolase n=1 Tax=Haematospirillum jordaniae TaxID=1549855 RepID=UPI001432E224|nr:HAD-IA family hydrolase [Haematospirillum jordaniae]NKD85653.1 HAD-IA family hydrolase [Haematospirillum jordaniae]